VDRRSLSSEPVLVCCCATSVDDNQRGPLRGVDDNWDSIRPSQLPHRSLPYHAICKFIAFGCAVTFFCAHLLCRRPNFETQVPYSDIKSIHRGKSWWTGAHIVIVNNTDGRALTLRGIIGEDEFINDVKNFIGDKDKSIGIGAV
jgi:hypothetical protein